MLITEAENLPDRMRAVVSQAWFIFMRKVGSGLISVNKEASMQLQFASILQQLALLVRFDRHEMLEVELETGVIVDERGREIDLLFTGQWPDGQHRIAIEMKCYRSKTFSGGQRGATDIFMKDVYFDLHLLERYVDLDIADQGIALVMNDLARLVHPDKKLAKCWRYDTSDGATFGKEVFDVPIGGKDVLFRLGKNYKLNWQRCGDFWFMEVEGD